MPVAPLDASTDSISVCRAPGQAVQRRLGNWPDCSRRTQSVGEPFFSAIDHGLIRTGNRSKTPIGGTSRSRPRAVHARLARQSASSACRRARIAAQAGPSLSVAARVRRLFSSDSVARRAMWLACSAPGRTRHSGRSRKSSALDISGSRLSSAVTIQSVRSRAKASAASAAKAPMLTVGSDAASVIVKLGASGTAYVFGKCLNQAASFVAISDVQFMRHSSR